MSAEPQQAGSANGAYAWSILYNRYLKVLHCSPNADMWLNSLNQRVFFRSAATKGLVAHTAIPTDADEEEDREILAAIALASTEDNDQFPEMPVEPEDDDFGFTTPARTSTSEIVPLALLQG